MTGVNRDRNWRRRKWRHVESKMPKKERRRRFLLNAKSFWRSANRCRRSSICRENEKWVLNDRNFWRKGIKFRKFRVYRKSNKKWGSSAKSFWRRKNRLKKFSVPTKISWTLWLSEKPSKKNAKLLRKSSRSNVGRTVGKTFSKEIWEFRKVQPKVRMQLMVQLRV